ncbi:MAG: cytochrome c [Deltaproteobacteria bacterium]|nr:MAG: cytochrome c [Deltaproteobacteria bacterium]
MRLASLLLLLTACADQPLDEELFAEIAALDGDAEAGALVYPDSCASCHGEDGTGGHHEDLPGKTADQAIEAMLTGPWGMPAFDAQFDNQTIADIAAFVETL